MAGTTTIKVALDWTPNTIHSGLYIALAGGLYRDAGLDVRLLPPDEAYTTTPARRLASGEVDLAICPSESCIAYNENGKMELQAIYAVLQRDASAIATRFADFKALENGVYGSYNARYEDNTVRAMITTAGGDGKKMRIQSGTGKLSLFEQMRQGDAEIDATWIFLPWEGVEAELDENKSGEVHTFSPEDFGVAYGYSPVIARNASSSAAVSAEALRGFVAATARGYEYAMRDAREAVAILRPHCRPPRSEHFLAVSQERINGFYSDGSEGGQLGRMDREKWTRWLQWLRGQGLLVTDDDDDSKVEELFTNEFFA